jgi:hypothetical protein
LQEGCFMDGMAFPTSRACISDTDGFLRLDRRAAARTRAPRKAV